MLFRSSDGFSPVREEKTAKFKVGTYAGEIHYADLESQPTNFGSASVSVGGQTKKMSSLTKMESLIYRDELDRMPWRQAMFFAAFARHVAAGMGKGFCFEARQKRMIIDDIISSL